MGGRHIKYSYDSGDENRNKTVSLALQPLCLLIFSRATMPCSHLM